MWTYLGSSRDELVVLRSRCIAECKFPLSKGQTYEGKEKEGKRAKSLSISLRQLLDHWNRRSFAFRNGIKENMKMNRQKRTKKERRSGQSCQVSALLLLSLGFSFSSLCYRTWFGGLFHQCRSLSYFEHFLYLIARVKKRALISWTRLGRRLGLTNRIAASNHENSYLSHWWHHHFILRYIWLKIIDWKDFFNRKRTQFALENVRSLRGRNNELVIIHRTFVIFASGTPQVEA